MLHPLVDADRTGERSPETPSVEGRHVRRGGLRFFAVSWLLLAALMAGWALATPLFASPDEPGQVIKAVAVAHGQLTGTTVRTGGYFDFETGVHVPAYYERALDETKCFIDDMGGTPSCAPAFDARDTHNKQVLTWIGRYPPLYYAIVGLPSLVTDGTAAVLAMRVVSAVLCGAFFALGLTGLRAARRPSSMIAAGWLAITPTALFFGAVVNASGLEIAAGFATWGVLMPLLRDPGRHHAAGRLLAGAGTAAVLLNSRPGSGLLVLLVVGCLVLAASGGFWRSVRPWRRWVPVAAVAGVAVLAAGLWLLIVDPTASFGGTPHPGLAAPLTAAHAAASASVYYARQQLAVFGILNLPLYRPLLCLLAAAIALLVVAALVLGRGRLRWALVLLLVLAVALPIVSQVPTAAHLGLVWQGRYGLPLSIGIPVVAMAVLTEQPLGARWASRLALLVTPVAALVQAGGFGWAFWRYAWGFGQSPLRAPISWLPPGGWLSPVLFIVADVVLTGLVLLQPGSLLRSARRRAPRQAASGTLRGTGSAVTSAATAAG
jgi:hypothetical protein